jgi:hypothetical protein
MWIFLNDAFVSIVAHRTKPDTLLVRARFEGDLQRLFPAHADKVHCTPAADYLFRVEVPRGDVADVLALAALSLDYPNFKGSVPERWRHDEYLGVWNVMWNAQNRQAQLRAPLPF